MGLFKVLFFALLVGNVLLRFFTNQVNVLPRFLNLYDVFATFGLAVLALGHPRATGATFKTSRIATRLLLFNVVCVCGCLLNWSYVYPMAALSQLVMWNEPILLFLVVVNAPFTLSDVAAYKRLLLRLIALQVLIGFCQVPTFLRTGASESIIGTFAGNAEQYQLFVCGGLFYLVAQMEVVQVGQKLRMVMIGAVFALVLLIDNKASWISLAVALTVIVRRLPTMRAVSAGAFRRLKYYGLLVALGCVGYWTVTTFSGTATTKFSNITEAWQTGNIKNLGKIKAARDILTAYTSFGQMALIGSGLGNFYSRAAFQYFPFRIVDLYMSAPAAGDAAGDSASMAGVITIVTTMEAFYRRFYERDKIFAIGSGTADFPTSSYLALFGECGLLGAFLYLSIYSLVLRQAKHVLARASDDAEFFPLVAAGYALSVYLLCMGAYNFWLDCGRVNTIVWSLLAISFRYSCLRQEEHPAVLSATEELEASAVAD